MNHPSQPDDSLDRRIQLLVDGELSEDALRPLIADLESDQNGWRRCALAFIESRVWGAALSDVPPRDGAAIPHQASRVADSAHFSYTQLGPLAASLLLAFLLGMQVSSPRSNSIGNPPQLTNQPLVTPRASNPNASAPAVLVQDRTDAGPNGFAFDTGAELGRVTMQLGSEGDGKSLTLPVYHSSTDHQKHLMRSSIPASLTQRLREAGIDVEHTLTFKQVQVGDEGVMLIPVEQLDFSRRPRIIP